MSGMQQICTHTDVNFSHLIFPFHIKFYSFLFVNDFILIVIGVFLSRYFTLEVVSYIGWGVLAIKVTVVWMIAFVLTELTMRIKNMLGFLCNKFGGGENG